MDMQTAQSRLSGELTVAFYYSAFVASQADALDMEPAGDASVDCINLALHYLGEESCARFTQAVQLRDDEEYMDLPVRAPLIGGIKRSSFLLGSAKA